MFIQLHNDLNAHASVRSLGATESRMVLLKVCPPSRPDMGHPDDCIPVHEIFTRHPELIVAEGKAVEQVPGIQAVYKLYVGCV